MEQPQLVETIRTPQGWEYQCLDGVTIAALAKKMAKTGQEGWETFQVLWDDDEEQWTAVAKRPITYAESE